MLELLPYLSLSEAAEYCNCTTGELLRLAEKGPEQIELLFTVDYEDMGFGPDRLSMDSGDMEHFLAIPSINAKELFQKGVTSVQTFLVSETAGWTVTMLDIVQRLSPTGNQGSVKTITCKSEWIVKKEDLYIMRESLDRLCEKREDAIFKYPTYLTIEEAAQRYNKSTNQILMEATKGTEHLELLYWVTFKQIIGGHGGFDFDGASVAGDYLVLPKERVIELRHEGHTGTACFFYPTRSPMHESMKHIRHLNRLKAGNNIQKEFVRCYGILLISEDDKHLFVTVADLNRIWPKTAQRQVDKAIGLQGSELEKTVENDEKKYPVELQAALAANREFSTGEEVTKSRRHIAKHIAEWFETRNLGQIEIGTGNRIAELITCKEISIVLKAWDAVYGQGKQLSREDMEGYLEKELKLKPSSVRFRRIAAVTTPDNCKPHNARH